MWGWGWGWGGRGLVRVRSHSSFPSLQLHICYLKELAASSPAPPSRGNRAVHLQVLLVVNSKKNLRNFFLIDLFSSDFASYLFALSPWQTPLTVRHRVIRLSMGRKLWPWAQSERIWRSRRFLWATAKLQRRSPDRLFKGVFYTTTVSVFPS